MTVSQGIYRGWKITIGIVPETSGQMFVAMEIVDPNEKRLEVFKKKIDDKEIRKIFNFPEDDRGSFGFCRLQPDEDGNRDGFQWMFEFSILPRSCTLYGYLAYIFKSTDELVDLINARVADDKEDQQEPTTPPPNDPEESVPPPIP